jgi:hypothetical protein
MGKNKRNPILVRTDLETLSFLIQTWIEYSEFKQSPLEIAYHIQKEFKILCTEEDVVNCLEIEDTRLQCKHLNLYQ